MRCYIAVFMLSAISTAEKEGGHKQFILAAKVAQMVIFLSFLSRFFRSIVGIDMVVQVG